MNEPQVHWSQIVGSLGQAFAAVGAFVAVLIGVVTYRRTKRREAAQWVHEVFQKFQLAPEFDEAKQIFDFQYRDRVEPLHAALVAGGNAAMLPTEWKTCHLIDRILNYLEDLVYLSDSGHAKWSDCCAYFEYWFDLLSEPERGSLRRYLVRFGYERLARLTRASRNDFVLLYGSLCADQPDHKALGLNESLVRIGFRNVSGDLYDLGDYPGLVAGTGTIRAELHRIVDMSVLSVLDKFEAYDHVRPNDSPYRRTTVQVPRYHCRILQRILKPHVIDGWIFMYNGSVADKPRVNDPSWSEYKSRRNRIAAQQANGAGAPPA